MPEQKAEDTNNAAQRFLNSGVGLKQLSQIAGHSFKLTVILKTEQKEYAKKAHPLNSVLS